MAKKKAVRETLPYASYPFAQASGLCNQKLLGLLGGCGGSFELLVLGRELGAELFHAAGFRDASLSAGVERMAGRRGIRLKERIGLAINVDGFLGLNGRTDDEGLVDGEIEERDVAILRVNALFHFS